MVSAETIVDLVNATIAGAREQLFAAASGLTLLILTFYVPLLWVSIGLIAWQLYSRRHEPLAFPAHKSSFSSPDA